MQRYYSLARFDVDVPGNMVYKESSFTTTGNAIVAEDSSAGRLGVTVCYDLRFPEFYQQFRFQHQAQVLLVPSAFTKVTGETHWKILLRARTIETECYVATSSTSASALSSPISILSKLNVGDLKLKPVVQVIEVKTKGFRDPTSTAGNLAQ